jgi:hypothetical protein
MEGCKLYAPRNRCHRSTFVLSPATSLMTWNETPMSPRRWIECPTKPFARRREKLEVLFFVFVHGGLPSPPILLLSRGTRLCHNTPTNRGIGWSLLCGPAFSELGSYHRKHVVLIRLRDLVPKRYVLGTRVRNRGTAVLWDERTIEAVRSQVDYSRPVHGLCSLSFT